MEHSYEQGWPESMTDEEMLHFLHNLFSSEEIVMTDEEVLDAVNDQLINGNSEERRCSIDDCVERIETNNGKGDLDRQFYEVIEEEAECEEDPEIQRYAEKSLGSIREEFPEQTQAWDARIEQEIQNMHVPYHPMSPEQFEQFQSAIDAGLTTEQILKMSKMTPDHSAYLYSAEQMEQIKNAYLEGKSDQEVDQMLNENGQTHREPEQQGHVIQANEVESPEEKKARWTQRMAEMPIMMPDQWKQFSEALNADISEDALNMMTALTPDGMDYQYSAAQMEQIKLAAGQGLSNNDIGLVLGMPEEEMDGMREALAKHQPGRFDDMVQSLSDTRDMKDDLGNLNKTPMNVALTNPGAGHADVPVQKGSPVQDVIREIPKAPGEER